MDEVNKWPLHIRPRHGPVNEGGFFSNFLKNTLNSFYIILITFSYKHHFEFSFATYIDLSRVDPNRMEARANLINV